MKKASIVICALLFACGGSGEIAKQQPLADMYDAAYEKISASDYE